MQQDCLEIQTGNPKKTPKIKLFSKNQFKLLSICLIILFLPSLIICILITLFPNISETVYNKIFLTKYFMTQKQLSQNDFSDSNESNFDIRILYPDQSDNPYDPYYQDPESKEKEDMTNIAVFMGFFLVFFLMSCYMISRLSALPEERDRVFLYVYITNDGFLFIAYTIIKMYSYNYDDYTITYIFFYILCGIGAIGLIHCNCLIRNILREDPDFPSKLSALRLLGVLFLLPCTTVCKFLSLSDDCCYNDSYTVYKDKSGNIVDDDKCTTICCNCIFYLIKRFCFLMTLMIYYISWAVIACVFLPIFIVYCILSLIIKGLCSLCNSTPNLKSDYVANTNTNTNQNNMPIMENNNYNNDNNNYNNNNYYNNNNNDLPLVDNNDNINSIN